MIIEAQNKEFFLSEPNNIHLAPANQEDLKGAYFIISDNYTGSLLLGEYRSRMRADSVYEEIKSHMMKRKKYYLMPRE